MFRSRAPLLPLPDSFLFGVDTSDHQCEAYDARREDIWDLWERQRGLTLRGSATDFERHFPQDVERARKLGCTAFRFSIAWSRVEPALGQFDESEFDYYGRLIAKILDEGMQPILTLHHFTWPIHVEQQGGMTADTFPAAFARYAREVASRLGSQVRYWITFNEPSQLPLGYIKPWWEHNYFLPPGLPEGATLDQQIEAIGRLVRNLFLAHTEARKIIKSFNPNALVGANPLLMGLPAWLQRLVDWMATRVKTPEHLRAHGRRFAHRSLPERGQADVVFAMLSCTHERQKKVLFSEAYFTDSLRLLVPSASQVGDLPDLAGKSVVAVQGSTAEDSLSDLVPQARALLEDSYNAALRALDAGKADALLADEAILHGLVSKYQERYRLVGEKLTREDYAAGITPGHPELLDVVDLAVRLFKASGEWAASCKHYFSEPFPEMPLLTVRALSSPDLTGSAVQGPLPLAKTGSALRHIQDRGCLIAAVKEDVPGFGYRDPLTGEFSGLEVDLARAVSRLIFGDASRVKFLPAATRERIPLLHSLLQIIDPLARDFSIATSLISSNWWHLGMAGKLAEFLCPPECVGQQDFIGIDYYWGIRSLRLDRLQHLLDAAVGRFDQAPVWPGVLYDMLRHQARLLPNLPVLIIENGSVNMADGVDRPTYLRDHIHEVQRAVRDGVNVIGYCCWSITSNREWGLHFNQASDFGLFHIDLDTDPDLVRHPTPSAEAYHEIITHHGAPPEPS